MRIYQTDENYPATIRTVNTKKTVSREFASNNRKDKNVSLAIVGWLNYKVPRGHHQPMERNTCVPQIYSSEACQLSVMEKEVMMVTQVLQQRRTLKS